MKIMQGLHACSLECQTFPMNHDLFVSMEFYYEWDEGSFHSHNSTLELTWEKDSDLMLSFDRKQEGHLDIEHKLIPFSC